MKKELINTPIGLVEMKTSDQQALEVMSNEQLIDRAVAENNNFCISPATYHFIEKRFLSRELQRRINPHIGTPHHYSTF